MNAYFTKFFLLYTATVAPPKQKSFRHYASLYKYNGTIAFCLFTLSTICTFSGTLTVEEVYKDRDQFASLVREVAAPDVGRMGIEVLSFTIKDVYDNVTYLASLGKNTETVMMPLAND